MVLGLVAAGAHAGDIAVQKVQGEVAVRQGVTEVWTRVAVGDVLRPDDTMKTGKKGTAVLLTRPAANADVTKTIVLPPEVIVDLSDFRDLSPEELMLKLTMEKVRASSYQWKNEELHIPNTTVVHGAEGGPNASLAENEPQVGTFQFNGTRVLFNNGFFSTCVLKAMELFRLYPALGTIVSNRLMVAEALEKAHLRGEALAEYGAIAKDTSLTAQQHEFVRSRMAELMK
jgi:hypothetical protein